MIIALRVNLGTPQNAKITVSYNQTFLGQKEKIEFFEGQKIIFQ